MHCNRLRALLALVISLGGGQAAWGQGQPPASSASAPTQFSQIPLRRDADAGGSVAGSAAWAALLLAAMAGAGFVIVRRKTMGGPRTAGGWLRPAAGQPSPKPLGRLALTQQASIHVVEWQGEELLLGCTSQSVTVLARRPAADDGKAKA